MPWVPDIKIPILEELALEPLNQYELARRLDVDEVFRIRGELGALRRYRLVYSTLEARELLWHITDRGRHAIDAGHMLERRGQLTIFEPE